MTDFSHFVILALAVSLPMVFGSQCSGDLKLPIQTNSHLMLAVIFTDCESIRPSIRQTFLSPLKKVLWVQAHRHNHFKIKATLA